MKPVYFERFLADLPDNVILLTTLETNRDDGYAAISKAPLDDLFDAAKPPRSFDAATTDAFVEKLDIVSELFLNAP